MSRPRPDPAGPATSRAAPPTPTLLSGPRPGPTQRILVVTDDVLTARMAGPAIRAWEIARALAHDHDVILATTSPVCELESESFGTEAASPLRFAELEAWCQVALIQGYVLERVPALRNTDKVVIVDLYDPIFLEDLELNRALTEPRRTLQINEAVRVFAEQLTRGDFFVCASEKQRDLWMGFLVATGRVNPATYQHDPSLRSLIDVVPFGLPDEEPRHSEHGALRETIEGIGPDDEIVLWGGGVYDWLDPVTAVLAIDRVRQVRPQVRLVFLGAKHPSPFARESRALVAARATAGDLGLTGRHVFFNEDWVPYSQRADYLLEADVGISLHCDHVETAYSFRTRILDCIWTGLPVVATDGDSFADPIDREGLGTVVPAGQVDRVADALAELLDDPSRREACRRNAQRMAPGFAWSVVLEPLVRFCTTPERAADLPTLTLAGSAPPLRARGIVDRLASPGRKVWLTYRSQGVRAVAAGSARALRRRL